MPVIALYVIYGTNLVMHNPTEQKAICSVPGIVSILKRSAIPWWRWASPDVALCECRRSCCNYKWDEVTETLSIDSKPVPFDRYTHSLYTHHIRIIHHKTHAAQSLQNFWLHGLREISVDHCRTASDSWSYFLYTFLKKSKMILEMRQYEGK